MLCKRLEQPWSLGPTEGPGTSPLRIPWDCCTYFCLRSSECLPCARNSFKRFKMLVHLLLTAAAWDRHGYCPVRLLSVLLQRGCHLLGVAEPGSGGAARRGTVLSFISEWVFSLLCIFFTKDPLNLMINTSLRKLSSEEKPSLSLPVNTVISKFSLSLSFQ